MSFKTRAEIWRHLLNGGKIKIGNMKTYLFLKDDEIYNSEGYKDGSVFDCPEKWSIYEEHKPKKKVTLYRYTYREDNGPDIEQTDWCSYSFKEEWSHHFTLLKTESKEVEYDDV